MTVFLLLAAAGFSIAGLVTDNRSMLNVGLVIWAVGLLSAAVGWLLRRGRHKFGSIEEAQAAAEAGDPRAMRLLALTAKVNGDTDRAEQLLLAAIDRGDVESMWEMGRLVEDRDGLEACEPWFRMAAENGHFVAKRFFRRGSALNPDGSNPL
ncbi:hypothetical protein GCM10009789_61490 [Kribbella sancticallisti]|uniref:Sel1 repeat family protein n=1 Tax=Kribbella sancticallisti TaxID=460087 RepID=A0ABP4Q474_9ACTN